MVYSSTWTALEKRRAIRSAIAASMAASRAFGAAAAPFDAAVGIAERGSAGDDCTRPSKPSSCAISAMRGLQRFGDLGAGAQHDARLADRLMQGVAQRLFDFGDGQRRRARRARACARRRARAAPLRSRTFSIAWRDARERRRAARRPACAISLRLRFGGAHLAGLHALARAPRATARRSPRSVYVFFWRARAASETRSPSAAELDVEGEFARGAHQYTSSSSPCRWRS